MSNDDSERKTLQLFGLDLAKVPCFRNTFLNGIGTGIGAGLLYFLFTSKTTASFRVCYGTFCVTSLSYWFYCRYHYSKMRIEILRSQEALSRKLLIEGSVKDIDISEFEKDSK